MRLVVLLLAAASLWPQVAPAAAQSPPPVVAESDGHHPPPLLELNAASEAELLDLPGVGPSRARAIMAYRQEHGGFRTVSQLLQVKGFGRALFKRLRPLVRVEPPPHEPAKSS